MVHFALWRSGFRLWGAFMTAKLVARVCGGGKLVMKTKYLIVGLALATVIVAGPSVAQATTYNISNDFSTASNSNGVWTYGYSTSLGGVLTNYNVGGTAGSIQSWTSSGLGGIPVDFNNPTGSAINTCGSCSNLPA